MRDKIRPVNLGDIFGDPETTIKSGGSGSGEPGTIDDDVPAPGGGGGTDTTVYLLDGFDRTPPTVDSATTESTGTAHSIALPDGLHGAKRVLLIFLTHTDSTESIADQLVDDHGLEQLAGLTLETTFGTDKGAVVGRVIDGTEDWANTGQTLAVTTAASETVHAYAVLLDGVDIVAGAPGVLGNAALSANPGAVLIDAQGWTG